MLPPNHGRRRQIAADKRGNRQDIHSQFRTGPFAKMPAHKACIDNRQHQKSRGEKFGFRLPGTSPTNGNTDRNRDGLKDGRHPSNPAGRERHHAALGMAQDMHQYGTI